MTDQVHSWTIPDDALERLRKDGFFITPTPISAADLDAINAELGDWKSTPAVNGYGCIFSAGDALLQNVGLYSPAALKIALAEDLLDFMERAFGQPALLAKIEYRRAVERKAEMPLHCDSGHGISVYIYLAGVRPDTGSTYVIPGTHEIGLSMNDGYLQVSEAARSKLGRAPSIVEGPSGLCLFFNSTVWHGRTATVQPGRELLWLSYVPRDWATEQLNLVLSINALKQLSQRQIDAMGTVSPVQGRSGEDFRLSRRLDFSSLNLLPLSYLVRLAVLRIARSTYHLLPHTLRALVGRAMAMLRPGIEKQHYKKITN
jgi:hypothetical protein